MKLQNATVENADAKSMANILAIIAAGFAILTPGVFYFWKGYDSFSSLSLNEWGDFLAGVFGPASIIIVSAGFLLQKAELRLQRLELKANTEALEAQKNELATTAREAERQNEILDIQSRIAEWNIIRSEIYESFDQIRHPLGISVSSDSTIPSHIYHSNLRRHLNYFAENNEVSKIKERFDKSQEIIKKRLLFHLHRLIKLRNDFIGSLPISGRFNKEFFENVPEMQIIFKLEDMYKSFIKDT